MREKRDENGKIIPSWLQRFREWRLKRAIAKGKIPRGRTAPGTLKGEFPTIRSVLSARLIKANGEKKDFGVISTRKITVAFRDYIVDSLQNSTTYPLDVFKYHACGTDSTAESNTDTTLGAEVESRVAGTQLEGATANIYKTVATISLTGTHAIKEHGIFSASSGGTLMDRSVFSDINGDNGDSIEFTYEATFHEET